MYVAQLRKKLQNPYRFTGRRSTFFFWLTETDEPREAWEKWFHLLDENQKGEIERMVTRKHEGIEGQGLDVGPR